MDCKLTVAILLLSIAPILICEGELELDGDRIDIKRQLTAEVGGSARDSGSIKGRKK